MNVNIPGSILLKYILNEIRKIIQVGSKFDVSILRAYFLIKMKHFFINMCLINHILQVNKTFKKNAT